MKKSKTILSREKQKKQKCLSKTLSENTDLLTENCAIRCHLVVSCVRQVRTRMNM